MFKIEAAFGRRTLYSGLLTAAAIGLLTAGPRWARAAIMPGTTGNLDFVLTNDDGVPGNSELIVGNIVVAGGSPAAGENLGTIHDPFELSLPVTFGTAVDFFFSLADPPDIFSVVLRDSSDTNFLVTTNAPGGTNRLFEYSPLSTPQVYSGTNTDVSWSVTGDISNNTFQVHIDTFPTVNATVPEPSSLAIWSMCAACMAAVGSRRQMKRPKSAVENRSRGA